MPKKILFAVDNQKLEDALKNHLTSKFPGEYIFANIVLQRKDMIINTVYGERPDILIIKDNLAGNEDIYSILYNLRMNYPSIRIVYICQVSEEKYDALQKYIAMGIYDIITSRSISIMDIVNLVVNPLNFSHWGSRISSTQNTIQIPENQPLMELTPQLSNTGTLKIKSNEQIVDTSSKKRVLTLVKPVSYSTGFMNRSPKEEDAEDALFDIDNINETQLTDGFNLDNDEFSLEETSNNEIKESYQEIKSFNLDNEFKDVVSSTDFSSSRIESEAFDTESINKIIVNEEIVKQETVIEDAPKEKPVYEEKSVLEAAPQLAPSKPQDNKNKNNILMNNRGGLYGIQMGASQKVTVSNDVTKRSFDIPKEYGNISSTSAKLTEIKKSKKQKANNVASDITQRTFEIPKEYMNAATENVEVKTDVQPIEAKVEEKHEVMEQSVKTSKPKTKAEVVGLKAKIVQKQIVTLFSEMESCSMNHTALNVAVKIAKEGKKVFYMDAIANGPFEVITKESTKVLLYDKYPITLRKFKCEDKYDYLENMLMANVSMEDMFKIIKRAKQLNDAEYIIINAPMEFDIDSLIVLADKRLVLLKEDFAHADRLIKEYDYRLKYMNLVIEEHNVDYITALSNVTPYKKQVFYLEDSKEMNFNALKNDEAVALREDCHEYDTLVKYVI